MQGKKDAYAEHHHHCDDHCYHSDSFYQHAEFYYYQYDHHNYQRSPGRTSINTQIGVGTPSVRLGVFKKVVSNKKKASFLARKKRLFYGLWSFNVIFVRIKNFCQLSMQRNSSC